jgi:hypothetical protein
MEANSKQQLAATHNHAPTATARQQLTAKANNSQIQDKETAMHNTNVKPTANS